MAAGSGFPGSSSFAGALWGSETSAAEEIGALGVSGALMNLAEGGNFVAYGTRLDGNTRAAFSWSQSQTDSEGLTTDWTKPNAASFNTGISHRMTDSWTAGLTFGLLNEQNGLLGTTYYGNGPLSLGETHQSMSWGTTSAIALDDRRDLVLDAAIVRSDGADLTGGIISDVAPLYARTFGAAVTQRDTMERGDNLSLSLRAPLRVFSGSASLTGSDVDAQGNPVLSTQRVNLTPSGNEMDLSVGYQTPETGGMSWHVSLDARHDADNVSGQNDADFLVGMKLRF